MNLLAHDFPNYFRIPILCRRCLLLFKERVITGMETKPSSMGPSSDSLWDCVMHYVSEHNRQITGNSCNWRGAFPSKSECSECSTKGGGALVKCCVEKCKKEYHVECGFRVGGFAVEDNGEITFHCESHFKPVTFCKCHRPYDVKTSAAMVCCDECFEWFHYDCVGLSAKQAQALENYVCKSCSQLLPSKQLRQANLDKEKRSAQQQEAVKSISLLVEVAETVCPLIDQLNKTRLQLLVSEGEIFTPEQMIEAFEYLSSYPFVAKSASQGGADLDHIDFYGTQDLISSWRQRLQQYKLRYNSWFNRMNGMIVEAKKELIPTLSSDYSKKLDDFSRNIVTLSLQYPMAAASLSDGDDDAAAEQETISSERIRRSIQQSLPLAPVIESHMVWFAKFIKVQLVIVDT